MKNLLLILSVFGLFFASCGGGEEASTDTTADTETAAPETPVTTDAVNNSATEEAAAPQGPFAGMAFAENSHDFGTINAGDVVEHTFTFTNTGETDLVISNARGSCGCTVPYYPKEPIAPGETGDIKVSYNSKGKKGSEKKNVTITANTEPATTVLNISAEVIPGAEEAPAN